MVVWHDKYVARRFVGNDLSDLPFSDDLRRTL